MVHLLTQINLNSLNLIFNFNKSKVIILNQDNMNRRKFIQNTALSSAGIGVVNIIPKGVWGTNVSPGDSLNIALVGCNSMGYGDLEQHLSNPGVNCVALCDIDDTVLNNRAVQVKKTYNQSPKIYKDFRKMLEQKDIDAVIVGTPDHWHCLITVFALTGRQACIC